ncbi:FAD/NAD(P)-binding protein [Poseidonocella sedimentorum]|uniref:FAD-NAD(P)-binding n=1 Tax=Poseidonocella sedimentorum TaxID=871652 RepID=A0A1I6DIB7_9RHOB|nr:FAD/NAD(P)-binding protein [Poseidonocella sedimentorum]SFR05169.1 FAD-NAD(P)-binding [Poseidonocella sedimentorum]
MSGPGPRIALVGMGPRALGALEALAERARARGIRCAVDGFDPFAAPGAGPNFDPDESPICKLNIPLRDIAIRPPESSGVGRFADWSKAGLGPDDFPTRAELGRYLCARYDDLLRQNVLDIRHLRHRITALSRRADGWYLTHGAGWLGPYDEVLLTLGQPPSRPDPQKADWAEHVAQGAGALAEAYPARELAVAAREWAGKTVAIRGLALSAFDILRVLTCEQGGTFTEEGYRASGREPARILPFSLNGQPPYPKPLTETLDACFAPLETETARFTAAIEEAASAASPEAARAALNAALIPPMARILRSSSTAVDEAALHDWLAQEWAEPGSQQDETAGPEETLDRGIAMATGAAPPGIGYVLGQLWRKWQDPFRAGYNPAETPAETAEALVGFDEGLKRYSYGPPVASSRELRALIDAGLVRLDLAVDPEIEMTGSGWTLAKSGNQEAVSVMIDAVMPSPDPMTLDAPLVDELIDEGWVVRLSEALAAHTAADGGLIGAEGRDVPPGLCLLGRLALGSVIAVDSLHDCFGEASDRWARGVLSRQAGA